MRRLPPLLLGLALLPAAATELNYLPVNPNFGGSPLNASGLLNAAQAQNKHKEKNDSEKDGNKEKTALEQFNETLQRSILNRVASAVSSSVVGAGGALQPGTVETTDFTITITDLGGGALNVTTLDKATGQSTNFQIGSSQL